MNAQLASPDRIADLGVVGAGGGGFPTHLKLNVPVPVVIANAAECEPLLHKDQEILWHQLDAVLRGLASLMECVHSTDGVIGIKAKHRELIEYLSARLPDRVRIFELTDTYPAGDEFVLVHDVVGRVIPPGGLPRDVGAVVANVETLANIGMDRPVTRKYLTVAGAVRHPMTLRVPIGVTIGEVIQATGGATSDGFGVLLGGVMMGRLARELDEPVTKTTGGIVVLPAGHALLDRYGAGWQRVAKIGRSACDQCSFCTQLCPRYLLGHPIEPHRAMQSLGFTAGHDEMIAGTLYCCECNLCSLYSCPESLSPKDVCSHAKPLARERGLVFKGRPEDVRPHPLAQDRRVPIKRLIARLGISQFNFPAPLTDVSLAPARVNVPLKQHAGVPAVALVKPGDTVHEGDLIAAPPKGKMGASIHASIDGIVSSVNGAVVIEA